MTQTLQRLIRATLAASLLACVGGALAQATPAGPPAGFVAPSEPQPDESNAERSKTQPGNNAPFWRAVRDSGESAGITNLPGAENGVLIQQFVQYPGSRFTSAGEAWRQVRNDWLFPYGGSLVLLILELTGVIDIFKKA